MKISILYKFRDHQPWGGANQFLQALRKYFKQRNCYEPVPELADILIFISYPFNDERLYTLVKKIKKINNQVLVINRMNGPISLYRNRDIEIDKINFKFNKYVADGTIYQSEWSRQECYKLGMEKNKFETVIMNAPDPEIFYPSTNDSKDGSDNNKHHLIAVSWSNNPNKGFDIYQFLDKNLDFNKYQMTFVGNSPVSFNNIHQIQTVSSIKLADILRNHDIFVFASKIETCSNSLIEALSCGLPVVARNNSSQPEIVGHNGVLFNDTTDVLSAINKVSSNLSTYKGQMITFDIQTIGNKYYDFCKMIHTNERNKFYKPKKWTFVNWLKIVILSYHWKIMLKTQLILSKIIKRK